MKSLSMMVLTVAAVAAFSAFIKVPHGATDEEEEEKPITSSAAQVSRDTAGHVLITIAPAAQKEIGLIAETLRLVVRPVEIEGYGFALDPAPLSQLNSDLLSADAALTASRAQFRRSRRLYADQNNVSLRDLQNARASYLADKSRRDALQQQLRDQWGGEIAQMDSRSRSKLVSALVDRRAAFARVTAPIGEQLDDAPRTAQIVVLGHEEQPLDARAVYNAPAVVPTLQGQTFLVLIATRAFPVRPGTAVSARLPTSGRSVKGVIVPRSAVVRHGGKEWVYRDLNGERFGRHEIVPAEVTSEGYFVTEDLAPGMRIVVSGAQTLLSEERKSEIQLRD